MLEWSDTSTGGGVWWSRRRCSRGPPTLHTNLQASRGGGGEVHNPAGGAWGVGGELGLGARFLGLERVKGEEEDRSRARIIV